MDASDSGEFTQRLVGLGEVFDADLSPVKQALYFEALRDLPLEAVVVALNQAARACKFFPKPAELRDFVGDCVEDDAARSWASLQRQARAVGAYRTWECDTVFALSVCDTFGSWPAYCAAELSPEMWASKRKEFLGNYQRHTKRAARRAETMWLSGWFELEAGKPAVYPVTAEERQLGDGSTPCLTD